MLLFETGQRRQVEERRERMSDIYAGSRDSGLEVAGYVRIKGFRGQPPEYTRARGEPVHRPGLTGKALDDRLDLLAIQFPGRVH